ncbi:helix-turn-helix domain-containing protein [candidate division WS5 bacterium]|uniref:Helix-turn-helix domain-containing protein n=1 Tax=candidate division WS5 bacterium TaxID=2093353 RepID=A0A419DEM2_9BACT|nr:MAG: helix-turn-helix domain-containing protein [candidate division WS5 bacterium]
MTPAKFIRTTISERETLGEKLAKKRNSLHLDIKDVERAIKIPARHVRNIEEGNYSKLPPDVYTRGFVKNYATFLGLNANKILGAYDKERGLARKVKMTREPSAPKAKPALKSPKMVITPKRLILIGSSLAVFLVLFFIGWQIKILTAPPRLSVTSPSDNINVTEDYVYVEGQTDREADLYINDVKIGTDDSGIFKERVSLQDGVNILKVKSRNKMDRETVVERKISAELPLTTATVDRTIYPLELKVVIGPNPATVEIVRDGEKLNVSGVMLAGSTQVFYAKNDIVITTNNAGSTSAVLNGKDLGPMGKEGQEIKDKKFSK